MSLQPEVKNIDCMEAMKGFPDKFFDLAIVDPPYGIEEDGHRENHTRSKMAKSKSYHSALWDQDRPTKGYFIELTRVSKNQIIWGANHLADLFNAKSSCWLVWNKAVMSGNKNHFADCELAYTSFETAVRSFEFEWQGMIQGNMKDKENRIHPTQKPSALYRWILKKYAICQQCKNQLRVTDDDFDGSTIPCETCNGSFKILDTHLGSGSSRIACHDMGFDFWGYEIDKDYFEAQEKRFKNHIAQLTLSL